MILDAFLMFDVAAAITVNGGTQASTNVIDSYTTATLVAGARLLDMDFPRPPAGIAIPRFVRLLYTTVGACAGSVSSGIVLDRDDQPYSSTGNAVMGGYPAGINIAN
jgi:hypothetical protein